MKGEILFGGEGVLFCFVGVNGGCGREGSVLEGGKVGRGV
jgi:hypothetical protein